MSTSATKRQTKRSSRPLTVRPNSEVKTATDKRRDAQGQFKERDTLGRSLPADRHRVSTKKATDGVVSFCVHGATGKVGALKFTPAKLIETLRVGLPIQELEDLRATLEMPMEKLFPMLGISKATLHRRKAEGRLGRAESDRVVRFARLMGKAIAVLESEENARRWLTSPQHGLGGAVPLAYAETEVGAREVEDLLGRIDYGVYS